VIGIITAFGLIGPKLLYRQGIFKNVTGICDVLIDGDGSGQRGIRVVDCDIKIYGFQVQIKVRDHNGIVPVPGCIGAIHVGYISISQSDLLGDDLLIVKSLPVFIVKDKKLSQKADHQK
jgi:hypothetical protein